MGIVLIGKKLEKLVLVYCGQAEYHDGFPRDAMEKWCRNSEGNEAETSENLIPTQNEPDDS